MAYHYPRMETQHTNSTSEQKDDAEIEADEENRGSGNGLEIQDKNTVLEENHHEGHVQLSITDDTFAEINKPTTQTDIIPYKSKHANEIAKVLGTSEELKEFDTVRYRLKSRQTLSRDDKQKHQRLLYKLQLSVQSKCSTLLKQLSSVEEQHFLRHGQIPKSSDCPEHDITTRIKHINKLLRLWNMAEQ